MRPTRESLFASWHRIHPHPDEFLKDDTHAVMTLAAFEGLPAIPFSDSVGLLTLAELPLPLLWRTASKRGWMLGELSEDARGFPDIQWRAILLVD